MRAERSSTARGVRDVCLGYIGYRLAKEDFIKEVVDEVHLC